MPIVLDAIDKKILRALQTNGNLTNFELASEVGLSPSPCLRRVNNLRQIGVISKYTVLLDNTKINKKMIIYARGTFTEDSQEVVERFKFEVKLIPQIMECYFSTGEYDFLMKILVADLEEYQHLRVHYLKKIRGVKRIVTEITLQPIKYTTEISL